MGDNDNHVAEAIGAELKERLAVDHSLPALLQDLMRAFAQAERRTASIAS